MDDNDKVGCGCIIALLAFLLFAFVTAHWTKTDNVQVVSHYWRIEQQTEDFQPRTLENWDEDVPDDAYDVECSRRSRGSHQVCSGSGDDRTCHRVTDYDQFCAYTADRWGYLSSEVNEGGLTDIIAQPEPSTRCTDVPEVGCQRYGQLIRTFTISFLRPSDDSAFNCNYDRDTWESLVEGQVYTMIFGVIFNEARCAVNGQ